jgi:hypothetical protein
MSLFSLFTKTVNQNKIITKNNGINLSIFIDSNKQMDIKYEFSKLDNNEIEILAKFLYALNKGFLLGLFIETLLSEKNSPDKNTFVQSVLDRLDDYYELEFSQEPIIKPSHTFTKNVK